MLIYNPHILVVNFLFLSFAHGEPGVSNESKMGKTVPMPDVTIDTDSKAGCKIACGSVDCGSPQMPSYDCGKVDCPKVTIANITCGGISTGTINCPNIQLPEIHCAPFSCPVPQFPKYVCPGFQCPNLPTCPPCINVSSMLLYDLILKKFCPNVAHSTNRSDDNNFGLARHYSDLRLHGHQNE